jgi:DNA polymerase-3 subunit beta
MEFTISKSALQKELGLVQAVTEKKNTIPALANILIESAGGGIVRITGTDLDVTLRCEAEAEVTKPGSLCLGARKLFEITRALPDAPVHFRGESNHWATVKCDRSQFRIAGVEAEKFPEVPVPRAAALKMPVAVFKHFIERTQFAITAEESRYTLSGAKFIYTKAGAEMVATDGHRLAYLKHAGVGANVNGTSVDTLIPRKALASLKSLLDGADGDFAIATDENHIFFDFGGRLLTTRTLTGQFPNYEMVLPKTNDKQVRFKSGALAQALRRAALMADDRSHAVCLHLTPGLLTLSAETAEEGESRETVAVEYAGEETEIGFNAAYLQDALGDEREVVFSFKDANTQAEITPVAASEFTERQVVMPCRL